MLDFLFFLSPPTNPINFPIQSELVMSQVVRPLSGSLDTVAVFNSNSPELVLNEGILLSTFAPKDQAYPSAHLNYRFQGRFDIFAHHIAKANQPDDLRTLYLGILLHNPSDQAITVQILEGATYLSQPDAPFVELAPQIEATEQDIYAGPGSRVMGDLLKGHSNDQMSTQLVIPPQSSQILLNLPIPVRDLDPPLNGRSTYVRLYSKDPLYIASLAKFAQRDELEQDIAPSLAEWQSLLKNGDLVTPRDRPPSDPTDKTKLIYGRVAGVSQGAQWQTRLTDRGKLDLTIPRPGKSISYGISTLIGGRLGTQQVQTAPMLVRYPDTAYQAHGNYGVEYNLTLPLYNPTSETQTVVLKLETPIKEDELSDDLQFLEPPAKQVFFRGLVKVKYPDQNNKLQNRYFHLVQRRGQKGEPLLSLDLKANERKTVAFSLIYPPDATPPQVLTLETLSKVK
ncbi:MAG: DUF3370 domain-containing protein [Microcystaceae cyanobacterium]